MATKTKNDLTQMLADARQALHELQLRIAGGDPKVTAADLDAAERQVRFAQVRVDHAEEAAARHRAEANAARIAELRAALPAICDTSVVDAKRAALYEALTDYLDATSEYAARRGDVWDELSRLDDPSLVAESGSGLITDREAGVTYRKPSFKDQIERMIREAWSAAYPRSAPPFSR